MKHIKLTLATTLTALAFLCACDDSSSAKDNASENDASSTQPPPQSDAFTTNEQYTYVFYNNDEGCGGEPAIVNIQYKLAPSSSNVKMTIKDPDETITETGMFREAKTSDGTTYYLIQLKDDEATYNYIPNEELIISVQNVIVAVYSKDANKVNALISEICAE